MMTSTCTCAYPHMRTQKHHLRNCVVLPSVFDVRVYTCAKRMPSLPGIAELELQSARPSERQPDLTAKHDPQHRDLKTRSILSARLNSCRLDWCGLRLLGGSWVDRVQSVAVLDVCLFVSALLFGLGVFCLKLCSSLQLLLVCACALVCVLSLCVRVRVRCPACTLRLPRWPWQDLQQLVVLASPPMPAQLRTSQWRCPGSGRRASECINREAQCPRSGFCPSARQSQSSWTGIQSARRAPSQRGCS